MPLSRVGNSTHSAPDDALAALATRVAEARRAAGLTLAAVAEGRGLSPAYVSQIESASANPTVRTLAELAAGLGCDVASLFGARESDGILAQRFEPRFARAPLLATESGGSGVWDLTAVGASRIFARLVRGRPGDHAEPISHGGEELVAVISGRCRLRVGSVTRSLQRADVCHFSAVDEHEITDLSDDLLLLVVLTEE
ncbi:MAG: helix-turn-helix domain-containing protein [Actinomycetes bacterium]